MKGLKYIMAMLKGWRSFLAALPTVASSAVYSECGKMCNSSFPVCFLLVSMSLAAVRRERRVYSNESVLPGRMRD